MSSTGITIGRTFFSPTCIAKHGAPSDWRYVSPVSMQMSPVGLDFVENWVDAHGATFEIRYQAASANIADAAGCNCCDQPLTASDLEETPSSCVDCGACCHSMRVDYVIVTDADYERMSESARAFVVALEGDRRFMKMKSDAHASRCAALRVEPEGPKFMCSIYEDRPEACRAFEQGAQRCQEDVFGKRRLSLVQVEWVKADAKG